MFKMKNPYIDLYCERIGPEYWSEPVNAVTNIAFILSAVAVTMVICNAPRGVQRDIGVWALNGLIYLIGIGSWLFHTHAVLWALLADIFPIAGFILLYTWYALRHLVGVKWWVCALGAAVVLGIAVIINIFTGYEGGAYIAALCALGGIGTYLQLGPRHRAGPPLLLAAMVFIVSLTLRTLDQPLCAQIVLGTHFVWHILNSVVLFVVAYTLIKSMGANDSV